MKKILIRRARSGVVIVAAVLLSACGTPAAKDFKGSWKPVNHFQEKPTEIPLVQSYTYYAAPMDETLKGMLNRWASDTGRVLAYDLSFDVTLYQPVSAIRTSDVQAAATQLNTIYAAQRVSVAAYPRKIVVQPATDEPSHAKVDIKKPVPAAGGGR